MFFCRLVCYRSFCSNLVAITWSSSWRYNFIFKTSFSKDGTLCFNFIPLLTFFFLNLFFFEWDSKLISTYFCLAGPISFSYDFCSNVLPFPAAVWCQQRDVYWSYLDFLESFHNWLKGVYLFLALRAFEIPHIMDSCSGFAWKRILL